MDREWISRRIYSTDHHDRGRMVALLLILCLLHHLPAVFGANLYACPGETVTLPCDGPADKDTNVVDMLWKFGSMTICSFKNGISKFEHRDFVNRTQLGSIRQSNFSLVINRVIVQDHGGYKCLINDKVIQRNNLFVRDSLLCNLHENKHKEILDENPPGALSSVWLIENRPVIVGIVVIVVTVVTVVIVGLLVNKRRLQLIRRRRNQARNQTQTDNMSINLGNLTPPCSETNWKSFLKKWGPS